MKHAFVYRHWKWHRCVVTRLVKCIIVDLLFSRSWHWLDSSTHVLSLKSLPWYWCYLNALKTSRRMRPALYAAINQSQQTLLGYPFNIGVYLIRQFFLIYKFHNNQVNCQFPGSVTSSGIIRFPKRHHLTYHQLQAKCFSFQWISFSLEL